MNTVKSGAYRWMIFRDGDTWVGVALEFNIVITGDDPKVVEIELHEAVLGYLESAKKLKKGFRESQINATLNQEADQEYEVRWISATQARQAAVDKNIPSPLSADIYKAGISNLATV